MTLLKEIEAVRTAAGIWTRTDYTVLQFQGGGAAAWLHAQTTSDVRALASGEGQASAMLDRQGRVLAQFSLHRWQDEYWLVIEKALAAALEDRVETHVIVEDVRMNNVGGDTAQILVEGPRSLLYLADMLGAAVTGLPDRPYSFAPLTLCGHEALAFRMTQSGEDGYLLLPAQEGSAELFARLEEGLPAHLGAVVSAPAQETLRIEAATLRYGTDIDETRVISETPLEQTAVNYDKGCYLGQEVVARLRAYGSPKRALAGLVIEDAGVQIPGPGAQLHAGGKRVGELCSHCFSPTLGQWIALAYLDRQHRAPGASHTFQTEGGAALAAKIVRTPFVVAATREDRAQECYDRALTLFEADAEDKDETPIALLEQALLFSPAFEDAYETLGVILHRQSRGDEAIECMKRLEALNPNSVMAHTNLSVFYVAKGMIQQAEDEKAKAEQLEKKQGPDERRALQSAKAERARIRDEAGRRIALFEEVLAIDAEDLVATMGLGSAYIQLDRHAEAIPHLETALRVNKDYSAAWLNLGKCHEFLERPAEAALAYTAGIEAASRKGDLMPMREMERRLVQLNRRVSPGG